MLIWHHRTSENRCFIPKKVARSKMNFATKTPFVPLTITTSLMVKFWTWRVSIVSTTLLDIYWTKNKVETRNIDKVALIANFEAPDQELASSQIKPSAWCFDLIPVYYSLLPSILLSIMKTIVEAFAAFLFVVMWGSVQVEAFVLLPAEIMIQSTKRRTSPVSRSMSMSTPVREEGNLLKFGSRIPSKR